MRVWGLSEADRAGYQAELDRYWAQNPNGDGSGAPAAPIGKCAWQERREQVTHTDRIWWITVVNPFVVVSDAAPLPPNARLGDLSEAEARGRDPLGAISMGVRWLGLPPETERDECIQLYAESGAYNVEYDGSGSPKVTTVSGTPVNVETPVKPRQVDVSQPIWPYGLAANVVIGAAFFWVAVRRLRVPYGTLPKGTRVA